MDKLEIRALDPFIDSFVNLLITLRTVGMDGLVRLGRVITHALLNVFTKIVTSPFSALGAVFGGKGEEVSFQEFVAVSFELQESSMAKLDAVAKGLFERPVLQLEIEGSVDVEADRLALRCQSDAAGSCCGPGQRR